jgi:hypothetical protein
MTAGTLYLVPNTLGEGDESMLAAVRRAPARSAITSAKTRKRPARS